MTSFVKTYIRPILKRTGLSKISYRLFFAFRRTWLRLSNVFYAYTTKTARVLTYHRIADVSADPHMLCVTPTIFESHLQYISKNFTPISLSTLIERIASKQLTGTELVITFDDGYKDNLTNALPLLEKYNIPATIFVTTQHLGQYAQFPWDEDYPAQDKAQFLTEEELQVLEKHPLIEIGAHTHTHPRLSALTQQKQHDDILQGKKVLGDILGNVIRHFAYPFGGVFDHTKETHTVVQTLGFQSACTTLPKLITHRTNIFQIPRFNVRNYSQKQLRTLLSVRK